MEQFLEKLFESVPKARILRLFMQNQDRCFTLEEIIKRGGIKSGQTRKELLKFLRLGLLKKNTEVRREEIQKKSRSKNKPRKIVIKTKRVRVFCTNPDFFVLRELQNMVVTSSVASRKKLFRQIKGLGNIKLAVISGVFINSDRARTDLLIVGDNIKKGKLERFLSQIESEIGKSLRYTTMNKSEFIYRLDMYDRFLRDILEYPHEKLINKVGA